MTMRLLIVADNALIASEIRRGFRETGGCTCLGFVPLGHTAAIPKGAAAPEVIIVDGATRDGDVVSHLAAIRTAAPGAKILVLAGQVDAAWVESAVAAGAEAVFSRSVHRRTLATLVREVVSGTIISVASRHPRAVPKPPLEGPLTGRELEILRLVAGGASNARIAETLWVTEQTVKFHLSNVYRKLKVANRTEASHYAYTRGLLDVNAGVGRAAGAAQIDSAAVAA
jgi:DNA-binding NarL/FixJ family response regulator